MSQNGQVKIGYVPREIEPKIEQLFSLRQIIALVGPRRSGKTTLLLHLKTKLEKQKKRVTYLSFEDQEALSLFETNIKMFARLYLEETEFLFLDEFHYAKQGGKHLKYLFDFYPEKRIVISGSSATELSIQALKHLFGRVVTVTLYPFSFSEFLLSKNKKLFQLWQKTPSSQLVQSSLFTSLNQFLEEYLTFGGYPEVVLAPTPALKKQLLKNIVNLLFLREVRDFLSFAENIKLQKLLQALSLQIGNLVNLTELCQTTQLDFKTLKRYLAFLEKVFLIRLVPPFFTNKRKELVKTPKVYFYDLGLRNALLDNFASLDQRVDAGQILENGVFGLIHDNQVKFWRTKSGAEVDFVLEKEGQLLPLEVKFQLPSLKISRSLSAFITAHHPQKALLVSFTPLWEKKTINKTEVVATSFLLLPKLSLIQAGG